MLFFFRRASLIFLITLVPLTTQGALSLSLDYLFWRPSSEGFFVALTDAKDSINLGETNFGESIKLLGNEGSSGFRLGATVCLPYSDTEGMIRWTYYSPNDSKNYKERIPDFLSYTGLPLQAKSEQVDHLKGEWELDLHTVDVALAKSMTWFPLVTLRPYIGFQVASIDQSLEMSREGTLIADEPNPDSPLLADVDTTEKLRQDFQGLGPTVGIEGRLSLLCGIGIYGSIGGAFLYGDHDISDSATIKRFHPLVDDAALDKDAYATGQNSTTHSLRGATRLEAGLFWHLTVLQGLPFVDFKLGWEKQQYFNQNVVNLDQELTHLTYEGDDLILQGLTLSMAVNF